MGWRFWQKDKTSNPEDFGFAKINHEEANLEYLLELLQILQKSFDEKQKTFSQTEAKARYFLTSFMALFYAVLGFSFSQFSKLPLFSQVFIIAIIIPFILTAYYLFSALVPRDRAEGFNLRGHNLTKVKDLIEAKKYNKQKDYVARCAVLVKNCEINSCVNKKKSHSLDNAVFMFMASPILAFFTWAIISAISYHFSIIRIGFESFIWFGIVATVSISITVIVVVIRHFHLRSIRNKS